MSIRLSAQAYRVPTDAPEADGTAAWDSTTMVVVFADAEGATGLGWTYGPAPAAGIVGEMLAPVVAELDPADVGRAWARMRRRLRNAGRPGVAGCALSAVDCALWDLKARLLGLPLARLLGVVHPTVPIYGSGGFTTYDAERQHRQLSDWVHGQGISRVKIKIGEGQGRYAHRDLRRMAAARESIGERAELFVDANGAYTAKQAVRVLDAASGLGVVWFEEPVSSDDLEGLRVVRDRVRADVAAGEYGYDLVYFQRMAPFVDCLQIDVTRCGGITEFLRAAAVAAAHGLEVSTHTAPNQHLPVAAALPNLRHVEWFHDHVRIERMFLDGAASGDGGLLTVNVSAPGNGLTFRSPDAQPYRVG